MSHEPLAIKQYGIAALYHDLSELVEHAFVWGQHVGVDRVLALPGAEAVVCPPHLRVDPDLPEMLLALTRELAWTVQGMVPPAAAPAEGEEND